MRRLAKHWDPMNAKQKPEKGTIGRQTADGKQGRLSRASTCTTNVAARLMFRLRNEDHAEIERNSDVECSEKRSGSISRFVNIPASVHQTTQGDPLASAGRDSACHGLHSKRSKSPVSLQLSLLLRATESRENEHRLAGATLEDEAGSLISRRAAIGRHCRLEGRFALARTVWTLPACCFGQNAIPPRGLAAFLFPEEPGFRAILSSLPLFPQTKHEAVLPPVR